MFGKHGDKEQKGPKLAAPRDIPATVKKYIASTQIIDGGMLPFLKAVVKSRENGEKVNDIYIFDPSDEEARGIKVHNYQTVKENPELIIAEGWFDETDKKVELTPKKAIPRIKFYTDEEILQQIQGLKEPGNSVFFYANAGTGAGGPLGRGAVIIRLNAAGEGKKTKKYSIYGTSVIDMQPIKNESKVFDSDKAEDIAKWVSQSHKPRFC